MFAELIKNSRSNLIELKKIVL